MRRTPWPVDYDRERRRLLHEPTTRTTRTTTREVLTIGNAKNQTQTPSTSRALLGESEGQGDNAGDDPETAELVSQEQEA